MPSLPDWVNSQNWFARRIHLIQAIRKKEKGITSWCPHYLTESIVKIDSQGESTWYKLSEKKEKGLLLDALATWLSQHSNLIRKANPPDTSYPKKRKRDYFVMPSLPDWVNSQSWFAKRIHFCSFYTAYESKLSMPCKNAKSAIKAPFECISGERGIRTPGGITLNSFQDCRNRPLCHFSEREIRKKINVP